MPNVIEFTIRVDGAGHVAFDEFEVRISFELAQILPRSGNEVVEGDDAVAAFNQTIAKMGTDESGGAG